MMTAAELPVYEIMLALAGLEADELREVESILKKRQDTTEADRDRLFELLETRDDGKVSTAFILVTSKGGARTVRRDRRKRR